MNGRRILESMGKRVGAFVLMLALVLTGAAWPKMEVKAAEVTIYVGETTNYTYNTTWSKKITSAYPTYDNYSEYISAGAITCGYGSVTIPLTGKKVVSNGKMTVYYNAQNVGGRQTGGFTFDVIAKVTFNQQDENTATFTRDTNTSGIVSSWPSDPTRAGYTFKGWNTKSDGTGEWKNSGSAFTTNTSLYGIWKLNHQWAYKADGNTITAYCTGCDNGSCPDGYGESSSSLKCTVSADSVEYIGGAYIGAKAIASDKFVSETEQNAPDIKYYTDEALTQLTTSSNSGAASDGATPKYAGTYYAAIVIGSAVAKQSFTISKINQPVATAVSMENYKYGESVSSPSLTNTAETPEKITFYYTTENSNEDGIEWKDVDAESLEPGTYYMYAKYSDTTNYNEGTTATTSFRVIGKTMTGISAGDVTVNYDGKSHNIVVNTGDLPNPTIKYGTSEGNYDLDTCPAYTDVKYDDDSVSSYTIYYKVSAKTYEPTTGSATVTINPKPVTAIVTAEDKTYDGKTDAVVTASIDTGIQGEELTITGLTGIFSDQNASDEEKAVTVDTSNASITADEKALDTNPKNYVVSYDCNDSGQVAAKPVTAKINQLEAQFTWDNMQTDQGDFNLLYTGEVQTITATISNKISCDKVSPIYQEGSNTATAVGNNYKAIITGFAGDDAENYKLPNQIKCEKAFSINYLDKSLDDADSPKGTDDEGNATGWYTGNPVFTLPADCPGENHRYQVSTDGNNWNDTLEISNTTDGSGIYIPDGAGTIIKYYIKDTTTGGLSEEQTWVVNKDSGLPTGSIAYKDKSFTEFLNTISFKHFFKDTVEVIVTGEDGVSGLSQIAYMLSETSLTTDECKNATGWIVLDYDNKGEAKFSIAPENKGLVYAKIMDVAGNTTVINADGVVVYSDATASSAVNYQKPSLEDVSTGILVHSNTIASMKNGENLMDESSYAIIDDQLVLKVDYLKTLKAGSYDLTVTYNPLGEKYVDSDENVVPQTSKIDLTVTKSKGTVSITNIDDISKIWDGSAIEAPVITTTNTRGDDDSNVTVEYKLKGAADAAYDKNVPVNCGKYVVRIKVVADDDYQEAIVLANLEINHKWADQWTTVVNPTTTCEGKMQDICEGCGQKKAKTIAKLSAADENNSETDAVNNQDFQLNKNLQSIEKSVTISDDAPVKEAKINTSLYEMIQGQVKENTDADSEKPKVESTVFIDDEIEAITNGDKLARVWLEIEKSTATIEEKNVIEQKALENSLSVAAVCHFDANLYKEIFNKTTGRVENTECITDPGIMVSISMEIPEDMRHPAANTTRTFRVVRLHDGVAQLLDAKYDDATYTLTFETDKFSSYAIVYKDEYHAPVTTASNTSSNGLTSNGSAAGSQASASSQVVTKNQLETSSSIFEASTDKSALEKSKASLEDIEKEKLADATEKEDETEVKDSEDSDTTEITDIAEDEITDTFSQDNTAFNASNLACPIVAFVIIFALIIVICLKKHQSQNE